MKFLIALILAAPLMVFANDTAETKVPVKDGYGTLDMSEFKGVNSGSQKSGVKFTTGCKSKSGVDYKDTDSGYAGCLSEAQHDKAIGTQNGASPNLGFKIGD